VPREPEVREEPEGASRTPEAVSEVPGTASGQDYRRALAAALGLLDVGDVEGAQAVLRELLRAGRLDDPGHGA
jgi:hypothetical protein